MTEPTRRERAAFHGVSVALLHVRITFLNELQYRGNFVAQIFQSLVQIATGLTVVAIVYGKTTELNGWNRAELLAAVGVFTIVGGVFRSVVQPPLLQFVDEVQDGTFDFVLTRPVDAQILASVRGTSLWQLADVVVGLAILAVAVPDLPSHLDGRDIFAFVALLLAGAVIAYAMSVALSCVVFWVVRLPSMWNVFYYVTRAAQYPISIYPMWLRLGLTVVVPLGIAVTAPAEAVTSRLSWGTAAAAVTVAATLVVLSRLLWIRGVRRYSGASA